MAVFYPEVPMPIAAGSNFGSKGAAEFRSRIPGEVAGVDGMRRSPVTDLFVEPESRATASNLHPAIAKIVELLRKGEAPAEGEAAFVREGKATIQVWLKERSETTVRKLKELGFELLQESKAALIVIGRLPIGKLDALSRLDVVRYVAPL